MIDLSRFSLEGRTAIVTGASSGLGVRFAKVLSSVGANVVVAARRADTGEPVAASIRADGGSAVVADPGGNS